jgi:hypothetical protein
MNCLPLLAAFCCKGIGPGVLKPGDVVKIYGFQARDGSPSASAGWSLSTTAARSSRTGAS